ncbi:unnamed protein product, partial [Meganyctiphanes norvegica]
EEENSPNDMYCEPEHEERELEHQSQPTEEELKEQLEMQLYQQQQQRGRSLDEQLCRGELPYFGPPPNLNSIMPVLQNNSVPLPNASSSPHTRGISHGVCNNVSHTNSTQSPSSSTLTLMKKQITEIEREIALRKPEGVSRRGQDGDHHHPPLDLHLLDPLNEKMAEPPPPPAPHPHRGAGGAVLENGSTMSPNKIMESVISPSRTLGHLHSPQYTPVSGPPCGSQLINSMGSVTSPGQQQQVAPHMVPGHPASHDVLICNSGAPVGQSRESVEAAIADIKQAIRRTKNLPLKSHNQDRSPGNEEPVWLPRSSRSRDSGTSHSSVAPPPPPMPVTQQQQSPHPEEPQHPDNVVQDSVRTPEHHRHEE